MSVLYLHIGLPKTGTTAVQEFLWDNKTVLEDHGIGYPDPGMRYPRISPARNAHFLVMPHVDEKGKRDKYGVCADYERVLDQLAECGRRFDRIFLSEETIWRFRANQPDFWKKFKEDLAGRGLSLRIIAYLRRQDNFILSIYRQRVKSTFTGSSFYDYMDTLSEMYPIDFSEYMDMLSGSVGRENLIIRVYEKEQFRGEEHNLFSDFLDIFGLRLSDGFHVTQQEYNLTLDGTRFELRRILNMLPEVPTGKNVLARAFHALQNENPEKTEPEKTSFFKPGEQTEFLNSFADSNQKLAREYLGKEDGILFYNDKDIELPQYHADTEALLRDTIFFYARTVEMMESEIQSLREELKEVRENVVLYRLKRKFHHIFH